MLIPGQENVRRNALSQKFRYNMLIKVEVLDGKDWMADCRS